MNSCSTSETNKNRGTFYRARCICAIGTMAVVDPAVFSVVVFCCCFRDLQRLSVHNSGASGPTRDVRGASESS